MQQLDQLHKEKNVFQSLNECLQLTEHLTAMDLKMPLRWWWPNKRCYRVVRPVVVNEESQECCEGIFSNSEQKSTLTWAVKGHRDLTKHISNEDYEKQLHTNV